MAIRIQLRKDHPNVWDSADPTLAAGEFGFAWDSADSASFGRLKIGDGSTSWTNLPYFYSAGDSAGNYASAGVGAGIAWGGDRGLLLGGDESGAAAYANSIEYIDITSASNATDFGDMDTAKGWTAAVSDGSRIVYAGGNAGSGRLSYIGYITSSTPGNATQFGTLGTAILPGQGFSDGTYGVFGTQKSSPRNYMQYVTIQTTANSTNFGTLSVDREHAGGCSDGTYGYNFGGLAGSNSNIIDYVAIATPGNATDYGDLITSGTYQKTVSDGTYGVTKVGVYRADLEYVTLGTPSNASDFGDISTTSYGQGATGNATIGVFVGGYSNTTGLSNSIDQITIQTPANATDFGDLSAARQTLSASSGSPS